jgi:secondary thiamine-phosphate synthase enzyme
MNASIEIETERRTQLLDVTDRVRAAVAGGHAALARQVAADVETALDGLVDERAPWRHLEEGDRNPWAHIRAILTASSLTIPMQDRELALGEHQAIFLCEFDGPRTRTLLVTTHA